MGSWLVAEWNVPLTVWYNSIMTPPYFSILSNKYRNWFLLIYFIEVQLAYHILLISAVQQVDSFIHIYRYILLHVLFHFMFYHEILNILPCAMYSRTNRCKLLYIKWVTSKELILKTKILVYFASISQKNEISNIYLPETTSLFPLNSPEFWYLFS